MNKRYFLIILLLVFGVGLFIVIGFNNASQEGEKQVTSETAEKDVKNISKENLYASVQHYMEWGLYEQYVDYYLNYMSQEQTDYYNEKADAQEIFQTLKEIYTMTFDYNNIGLKEEDSEIQLSIPVQIMGQKYQYVYIGEWKDDQNCVFNKGCLYKEDGIDIFEPMEYSNSVKVKPTEKNKLIWESSLQKPNEEYVAYLAEWEFLNNGEYVAGDKIVEGTYYRNGDENGDFYTIQTDNQIVLSTQDENTWYFKTIQEAGKNYLCYGYSLTGCGIDGGNRVEYTQNSLIVDGVLYELKR